MQQLVLLLPIIAGTGGDDDVDRWAALLVFVDKGDEPFATETLLPLPLPRSTSNNSTESNEAHAASAG